MTKCTLSSNSGREFFSLSLSAPKRTASPDQLYCDAEVEMKSEIYLEDKNNGEMDLYEDAHIKLSNLTIPLEGLQLLCRAFTDWKNLVCSEYLEPRDPETFFDTNLMNDGGRKLDVLLRTSNDLITSPSQPLFEFFYSSWATSNFVQSIIIDQSCAKIFVDNLQAAIEV